MQVSKEIRTYTEQLEEAELVQRMRTEIINAETLVFLGVAFHDANIELIAPKVETNLRRVFATTKGFSQTDTNSIIERLHQSHLMPQTSNQQMISVHNNFKCFDLLSEFRKTLCS